MEIHVDRPDTQTNRLNHTEGVKQREAERQIRKKKSGR
jgi:hypothetical protein